MWPCSSQLEDKKVRLRENSVYEGNREMNGHIYFSITDRNV